MKHRFILMTNINPEFFGETLTAAVNCIEQGFCDLLIADNPAETTYHVTSPDKAFLEAFCEKYNLGGLVVECCGIYDNIIQEEVILED